MKRVALITSRFPYGPKEAFLREEIAELARVCELVVIPALPTKEAPTVDADSARLRLFSPPVLIAALREMLRSPSRTLETLLAVLRAPRSPLAKLKNLLVFPTGLAAARIVRERGIEHVHAYWLAIPATVAYVAAAMNDLPWSATGHRYDLVDSNMNSSDLTRTFISSARFIRTISKAGEARVRDALGDTHGRLLTEHLGVRLPPAAAPQRPPAELRVICAANLEYVKGHRTLLEALSRARAGGVEIHCTLAGDGTLRRPLEAYAQTLGLSDCVRFAGVVPHGRLLESIQSGAFDVALLTSVDDGPHECEGIPIFLAESMAAGLPVIATRSGAVGELVDSSNGILCDPGDDAAIAHALATLYRDAALRAQLGAAGRETIHTRFDVRANAHRIATLFMEGVA